MRYAVPVIEENKHGEVRKLLHGYVHHSTSSWLYWSRKRHNLVHKCHKSEELVIRKTFKCPSLNSASVSAIRMHISLPHSVRNTRKRNFWRNEFTWQGGLPPRSLNKLIKCRRPQRTLAEQCSYRSKRPFTFSYGREFKLGLREWHLLPLSGW